MEEKNKLQTAVTIVYSVVFFAYNFCRLYVFGRTQFNLSGA